MNYRTTLLEDWIKDFYYDIGILHPHQIDMHDIIYRLGMSVKYMNISSRIYEDEVIIDERLSKEEQWEEFGHEFCHFKRHFGNQLIMPEEFLKLQEFQANYFSYHFCVPTFMLIQLTFPPTRGEVIKQVAQMFKVTYKFAEKRFVMFENRINSMIFSKKLHTHI